MHLGPRNSQLAFSVLLIACTLGGATISAGAANHPVNLSLFYPVSTNQDPTISTNLRLSLLYGHVGEVRGADINGIVAITGGDVRWAQLNGAYSLTFGDFHGLQYTFAVNQVRGDVRGLQFGGLVNFDEGQLLGVQFAGFLNYTQGGFRGVQITPIFNLNDGDGRWLQLSGVAGVTAGDFSGAQVAALFNYTNQKISGAQLSFLNFAYEAEGAQIGFYNSARTVSGVQVGVYNRSGTMKGMPIGVVNYSKDNGRVDMLVYADSRAAFNVAARTVVNRWYSILSLGFYDIDAQREDTIFLKWNYGREFPLNNTWRLGLDLGYVHVIPQPATKPEHNPRLRPALQLRLMVEHQTWKKSALHVGIGIHSEATEYNSSEDPESSFLIFGGVSFF